MKPFFQPSSVIEAAGLCLILFLALIAYLPAVTGPFLFDDYVNLDNLAIISGTFSIERLGQYLHAWNGLIGRPLSALSFLIEDHAWPTDPEPYKRTNLYLHLLAGVFLFAFSRRILSAYCQSNSHHTLIASLAFAAWLIHPLHVSTLMLVVQRMAVLSNLFIIIGLTAYTYLLTLKPNGGPAPYLAAISLLIFGTLAFAAKENGVLIFAYAAVLNLTLLRPTLAKQPSRAQRVIKLLTYCLTGLIIGYLLYKVSDPSKAFFLRDFSLTERLLSQARLFWIYLFEIALPNFDVTPFHDDFQVSRSILSPISTLASVAGVLLAASLFTLNCQKRPLLSFCIGWFFVGHLIESTVIPLEMRFDHRNYLAMYGPLLGLVLASFYCIRKPTIRFSAIGAWLILAFAITFGVAQTWGDRMLLANVFYHEHPKSVRAAQNLVSEHLRSNNPSAALSVISDSKARMPGQSVFDFMDVRIRCAHNLNSAEDIDHLIRLGRRANYERHILDIVAYLRGYIETGCNDHLTPEKYDRLLAALIENHSFQRRPRTLAYLYNQQAKLDLRTGDVEGALTNIENSYQAAGQYHDLISKATVAANHGRYCIALDALERLSNIQKSFIRELYYPLEIQLAPIKSRIPIQRIDCPDPVS